MKKIEVLKRRIENERKAKRESLKSWRKTFGAIKLPLGEIPNGTIMAGRLVRGEW